jgi:hypothetical protein
MRMGEVEFNILERLYLLGKISFKNLKRISRELGENLTDEEI